MALTAEQSQVILQQKLEDMQEDLGDPKKNFVATYTLPFPNPLVIESIDNDKLREEAFYNATLEAVHSAQQMLVECGINYQRPPDMFAEMIKTDEELDKIRKVQEQQLQKIQSVQAKHLQKKVEKTASKDIQQKRPGRLMKPHKDPKKKIMKKLRAQQ